MFVLALFLLHEEKHLLSNAGEGHLSIDKKRFSIIWDW